MPAMARPSGSPFLRGNWAPVSDETPAGGVALTVSAGSLPEDLCGCFLRIGPNPAHPEKTGRGYHFFTAEGMVHGVELGKGRAVYRNRFVRTRMFVEGTDDPDDRLGLANTAMVFHAGRLLCLEEGAKPWRLSLPELETLGHVNFDGRLKHAFTAHPKVCAETKELVFFGYGAHKVEGSSAFTHYSVANPEGDLVRTIPVNFRQPVMTHDMAITRNYTIFTDFPLWDMSAPTREEDRSRFGVLPRHATSEEDIVWFDAPGQYGYHVANAWERPGTKVVQLVMVSAMDFSFTRSNAAGLRLHLWAFDLATGKTVEDKIVADVGCDFPIVDARVVGLPTRYIWASRLNGKIAEPLPSDGLLRYDVHSGEVVHLDYAGGRRGGEAQFVPRRYSDGRRGAEGDGYLLVFAYVPESGSSELLIFDALTMSPEPLAVLAIPARVPYGFHALWVDEEGYSGKSASIPSKL